MAEKIEYRLVRSNRRSIALMVDSAGRLTVRAPHRARAGDIAAFVEEKREWIAQKQAQMAASAQKYGDLGTGRGQMIPYLGVPHTVVCAAVREIFAQGGQLFVPEEAPPEAILSWLKAEAVRALVPRVEHYAAQMGVSYTAIKLSEAKTRWGSCGYKNGLRFSWRLILCPPPVLDYIVVHELSHVRFKDHGPDFWAFVQSVLPGYKAQREWLRKNGRLMEAF